MFKSTLARGFGDSFLNHENRLQKFLEHINYCIRLREEGNADVAAGEFNPSTSVIQSKGSGKTRLMFEAAPNFHTFYACLRQDPCYPGEYPPRTEPIASYIDNFKKERDYFVLLYKIVRYLNDLSNCENQMDIFNRSLQDLEFFWKTVLEIPIPLELLDTEKTTLDDFSNTLSQILNQARLKMKCKEDIKKHVLIVLDEANHLVDLSETDSEGPEVRKLDTIRAAISHLGSGFFFIFIGSDPELGK